METRNDIAREQQIPAAGHVKRRIANKSEGMEMECVQRNFVAVFGDFLNALNDALTINRDRE